MSASIHRSQILLPEPSNASREFVNLGGSTLAYVRAARSEDVADICPEARALAPGQIVFILCAADGTPILVTDSHASAIEGATHEKLQAVSLH